MIPFSDRSPLGHTMRFLIPVLLFLSFAHPAYALDVTGVRFGTHEDKQRVVFELSSSTKFKAYTLENPSRMIIDLPDFKWTVVACQSDVCDLGRRAGRHNGGSWACPHGVGAEAAFAI